MEKLASQFKNTILTAIAKELKIKNPMALPKVEKVVISTGIGNFKEEEKSIDKISSELAKITGQKPKLNRSKKAVSAFKLRIGQPVGLTVTLRNDRMFDFISRFTNIALPRVRDFRGLSAKGFDGKGNYSIGIKDYSIFPEIKFEEITTVFGLQVNIKTTASNDQDAKVLLSNLGFPFEK